MNTTSANGASGTPDWFRPWAFRADGATHEANEANVTATDHLGRTIADETQAGPRRPKRQVGLFYYLWHGQHGTQGPYDVSKMEAADPDVMDKPDSPLWPDPSHTPMLHWGEPLFGYYLSTDEWVLRRHVEMFIAAGIDVLYFDTTNGYHYRETTEKLFPILQEYHDKGFKVPKFCYYMAPARRGCGTSTVLNVWLDYYRDHRFEDLYFRWDGKPLLITHPDRPYRQEMLDYFTFRRPTWFCPSVPDTWYWAGMPEPNVARRADGTAEMTALTVGSPHVPMDAPEDPAWPRGGNAGCDAVHWGIPVQSRSWHDGALDKRPNASHYGLFFQDQIRWALSPERDEVPLAFVCQWNEWLVPFLTRATNDLYDMPHWVKLQDEFNQESSRDIEPMKGGYQDAYYLQLMDFVRRWKGLPEPATAAPGETILYREPTGDCAPRNHPGYDACGVYVNTTGRNEFEQLAVSCDGTEIRFAAKTVGPLVDLDSPTALTLLLAVPGAKPDAMGYTHRFSPVAHGSALLETADRALVYRIPLADLGIAGNAPFRVAFKWSDNRQADDPMDFYVNGDAAPRGRLNYVFCHRP